MTTAGKDEFSQDEIRARRREELEALLAYYGNDLRPSLLPPHPQDSRTASATPETQTTVDDIPIEGPWFLRIRHPSDNVENDASRCSSLGTPTLEIRLPQSYPLGEEPPEPALHHIMMDPTWKRQFLQRLKESYCPECEVAISWGEKCREELLTFHPFDEDERSKRPPTDASSDDDPQIKTFYPPTTRYNQPVRRFPLETISDPKYRRSIFRTEPCHPPKSGPSETLIAHVAEVTCMEHVQWVLAELLFHDKKVAKATHNMFAYRFTSKGVVVSDNDDDGEKGSGSKLAALLEMCRVDDVLVVVSRWFGGVLLGPARFKYIASVAREGLVQGGFLKEGHG